jgi:hypothetical protein
MQRLRRCVTAATALPSSNCSAASQHLGGILAWLKGVNTTTTTTSATGDACRCVCGGAVTLCWYPPHPHPHPRPAPRLPPSLLHHLYAVPHGQPFASHLH